LKVLLTKSIAGLCLRRCNGSITGSVNNAVTAFAVMAMDMMRLVMGAPGKGR